MRRLSLDEFTLSDGISVASVYTTSSKLEKNILATFLEDFTLHTVVSLPTVASMILNIVAGAIRKS